LFEELRGSPAEPLGLLFQLAPGALEKGIAGIMFFESYGSHHGLCQVLIDRTSKGVALEPTMFSSSHESSQMAICGISTTGSSD
jgi:hypothetical protein